MNKKTAIVIALQALLIIVMFWMIVFYGKDEYESYTQPEDENIASVNRVSAHEGLTTVIISDQAQAQNDIQTLLLEASQHQRQLQQFGFVVAIDPLVDLRTQYFSAKNEAALFHANLENSRQEYQRLRALNQDNRNVADRLVLAAEAQYQSDLVKIKTAEARAENLREAMVQSWGKKLAQLATEVNPSKIMQDLLSRKKLLIQIALPFDSPQPNEKTHWKLRPTTDTNEAIDASYLTESPITDATVQGKTYFLLASSPDLRSSMRLRVSQAITNQPEQTENGVLIPQSAIVWHAGKAWVYQQTAKETFVRLPVSTDTPTDGGWYSKSNIQPGSRIVIKGAQLLLSEEFKVTIKNENDD